MNLERRHLDEELRISQRESTELRRKLHEINTEIVQVRQAYETNLRGQRNRDIRLDRLTRENREIRGFAKECLQSVTEMRSILKELENEKNFWKGRAMREQKEADSKRKEIENLEESVRKEREDILRSARDETEKRLTELSGLYDQAKEKVRCLEEETIKTTGREEFFEKRARELANLLTTLENFDLDIKTVCGLTATAVENLTGVGLSFDESVKQLRQFTWKVDNKKTDAELDALRSQNFVLREIVKSLKRRVAESRSGNRSSRVNCSKEKESDKEEKKIEESRESCNAKIDANEVRENRDESSRKPEAIFQERSGYRVVNSPRGENCLVNDRTNINEPNERTELFPAGYDRQNKDVTSARGGKVLCIESHTNGTFFEEYVIRFSNTRQMKIKHSPEASAGAAHLKLEFVDCEDKYQENSRDGVVILVENLEPFIKIERTGVNCATQTRLIKKCNNYTQTSIVDKRDLLRINAGHAITTMLNSEKRAIERNLSNLERTVADLKSNTLNHARSMIGKNSRGVGNDEFFKCIERLTGD